MSFEGSDYPRDFLYSDYAVFFEKFGVTLVLIPNAVEKIEDYFDRVSADGVILSGGNDLSSEFTGQPVVDIRNASMLRDRQEKKILDCAVGRKLPVLGICRGMQFINCYFGGSLTQNLSRDPSEDIHIAKTHAISFCDKKAVDFFNTDHIEVNSYHHQGVYRGQVSPQLGVMAISAKDDVVEGLFHPRLPIAAVQWHPERKGPSFEYDSRLINAFISAGLYWQRRE